MVYLSKGNLQIFPFYMLSGGFHKEIALSIHNSNRISGFLLFMFSVLTQLICADDQSSQTDRLKSETIENLWGMSLKILKCNNIAVLKVLESQYGQVNLFLEKMNMERNSLTSKGLCGDGRDTSPESFSMTTWCVAGLPDQVCPK